MTPSTSAQDLPLGRPPRRPRRVGSVADARRALWRAIRASEDLLALDEVSPALVLRVAHALSQSTATYARLCEFDDLAARVVDLERAAMIESGEG